MYSPALQAGFIDYDDKDYILNNPRVHGLSLANVRWALSATRLGMWQPLTWFSYMADHELYGLRPQGYHLTSLFFHLLNTALLFGWLARATKALAPSLFAAAVFALHPLHVESVAWVASRKDVLSTFCWLLAMWAYVPYIRTRKPVYYVGLLAAYGAGLAAKPILVTLPAVLLLLDVWPLRRLEERSDAGVPGGRWSGLVIEKIPLILLAAASSWITLAVQSSAGAVTQPQTGWLPRLASVAIAYKDYLVRAVWPLNLGCLYPFEIQPAVAEAVGAGALLAALTAIVLWTRRRYAVVGWLWFLGTLAPVSGIIRFGSHATADRFTYVPLVGLALAVAWAADEAAGAIGARRRLPTAAVLGLAGLAIVLMSWRTWIQAGYWRNSETIFRRTLAVTRFNPLIRTNLGAVLYRQGRAQAAFELYGQALTEKPDFASARNNLGVFFADRGELQEALAQYRAAVEAEPDYAEAQRNLGGLLFRLERYTEAAACFSRAAELNPTDAAALNSLGGTLYKLGRYGEAYDWYQRALTVDPANGMAHYNCGLLLSESGRYTEAANHYWLALRAFPGDPQIVSNLQWLARQPAPEPRANAR
jgi:tetratricopeptide (TPR) repeat protein